MTHSKRDVEELKRMQSDAAKLRAERKRRPSAEEPGAEHLSGSEENQNITETQAEQESAGEAKVLESDVQHFADQLASAVKQLEDTTREHPALALLAAFTTGVVVGHLFSRR